ncbi:MAG: S-layer homology domain-containing protein [Oscillospiraceae bacterium]|jgi:hypothetical protein|nr:S-layer homology domain-containing protein [Oscillospiraceae bacterium]
MMMKKVVSLLLVLTLVLGLTVPTMAAGQTFDDVPESYWGYKDIEAVSEAGYMNGIGGGQFAPEMKVSVAQFLTLLGRLVFPEIEVKEGETWYGPYVTKAQESGLLTGSQVNTTDVFDEIPRYDMAVVLRAAAKKLGISETQAQASEVTDYPDIPTRYAEAVLTVYGMGLIKGDNAGRFNGASTMSRAEIATVIMRLDRATSGGGTTPPVPTETAPTEIVEPTFPPDEELVPYTVHGFIRKTDHVIGRPGDDKHTYLADVPFKVYYTADGGATSMLVYEGVTGNKEWSNSNPHGVGKGECAFTLELPKDAFRGDGRGIYFSAETTLDGQSLVTSDLRTDGQAYKEILYLRADSEFKKWNSMDIELTPPNGEKAKFTFQGYVEGINFAKDEPDYRLANFSVKLHLEDGRVVGEAVSGSDGTFSMECEVDALDDGFSKEKAQYYISFSGYYRGVKYEWDSINISGKRVLLTLCQLHVLEFDGKPSKNPNYCITVIDSFAQTD